MRQASMNVINRDIDLTILAELANATIDTGAYATASLAMVEKAKAYLGNNDVPVEEEDNMFAVITSGLPGLPDADHGVRLRRLRRREAVGRPDPQDVALGRRQLDGVEPHHRRRHLTELCYMWHRSALGYAVNVGEDSIDIGYDDKQDTSWSRATIFHAAKILQNTGIVQMKHDGSAFNLS
jgi:hypothetical protein